MGSSYSIPPEKNVVNVGDEISQQLLDALNAAPTPSSGNPYATAADISSAISAIPQGPAGPAGADAAQWVYRGAYDNGITYAPNDYVTLDGSSYVMINFIGAGGYSPTGSPGNWQLIASKGDVGPQGPAGLDANQIGPTGPQGQQGDQGPTGNNGSNGNDGGSFPDVTNDGVPYVRINSSWQALSTYDQTGNNGIADAPADSQAYVRYNNDWQLFSNYDQNSGGGNDGPQGPQGPPGADGSSGIGDAPNDSTPYVRINSNWELLSNHDNAGMGDAPSDGASYVRINNGWSPTYTNLQGNTESAGFITPHYPYEVRITVNGMDYWMPVRPV